MNVMKKKLLSLELHLIIFGSIVVVFVSIMRYIFYIEPSDLTGNILIGSICFYSRLLFFVC